MIAWSHVFPHVYCVFEVGGCSDHLRCRIQINREVLKPKSLFKFTNVVTSFKEFPHLMEVFWEGAEELYMSTSDLFRFSKKLKALKPELRRLSKEKLNDLLK